MILLWPALVIAGTAGGWNHASGESRNREPGSSAVQSGPKPDSQPQQGPPSGPGTGLSGYEGKIVRSIEIPGVAESDRAHILDLLPQKTGEPLDRTRVRDSIRALYGTGRFADIQAEVTPAEQGITLAFTTSANFFVGAVNVEGAPPRPYGEPDRQCVEISAGRTLHPRQAGARAGEHPATHAGRWFLPGAGNRRNGITRG